MPLCALLSLIERVRALFGLAPAPSEPRRILVILLSEMGSLVLAQPMFARLQRQYPGAAVHALTFRRNREALDLLGVVPPAQVLTIDDSSFTALAADSLRAIGRMRALRIDVAIDCELFSRVSAILSYLSGAASRVGFHRHTQEGLYRGSFINRPVLYNPYRHLSQQFLTMVTAIGSTTVPLGKEPPPEAPSAPPHLAFTDAELQEVTTKLHGDFPALKGKRLVLVSPSGGLLPIRAWPIENFSRVSAGLLAEGCAVAVIGLQGDKAYANAILAHCAHEACVDLTGYTRSVRHLLAIFNLAELLIANDGGHGQLAALTAISSLVFFGPETPLVYGSLAKNSRTFFLGLPCSPCLTAYNHRASPCDGDNQCLKLIAPEAVLARAREVLSAPDRRR